MSSSAFCEWFDSFIYSAKPTRRGPVLFVLDGQYGHTRSTDLIDKARDNHINIICIPPHTTHKLQPLDKIFVGS